jgi:hypothetical protein
MKVMKPKILSIITVLITFFTICSEAQVKFGLNIGAGLQNITGKDQYGDKFTNKVVPRFNVGIVADFPIADDFFFETGLGYTGKGAKHTYSTGGEAITRDIRLHYLELPLTFLYKPVVGTGHFFLGFGPYISYAIAGNTKYSTGGDLKIKFKNSIPLGDTIQVYYKPLEMGANIFFGYEFANKVSLQFYSQLGLTNINPSNANIPNDKTAMKNSGFGIGLGYRF